MTVLAVALAIHQLAISGATAALHLSGLAGGVPNPAPKAPPGLTGPINTPRGRRARQRFGRLGGPGMHSAP